MKSVAHSIRCVSRVGDPNTCNCGASEVCEKCGGRGWIDYDQYGSMIYCDCAANAASTTGRSRQEAMMQTEPVYRTIEDLNRVEALANAVRHRIKDEDADTVVENAKKYFAFLQGEAAKPAA